MHEQKNINPDAITGFLLSLLLFLCGTENAISLNSGYIEISDHLSLYYEEAGDGDIPVILIPGWTLSTQVFERQLDYYDNSRKYKVISYDPRGQGLSTKTVDGHTYHQHGHDLKIFMEKLNLKNVVLAGHSYGVLDLLAYVQIAGIRNIRGVVVIDGFPTGIGEDNGKDFVWYSRDDADGLREWFTMTPLMNRQKYNIEFARWMLEDATHEHIKWISRMSSQTSDSVAALLNETGAYADYENELILLGEQVPLLYVMQEEWKVKTENWVSKNTLDAEVYFIGKHLMFWERAAQFNKILDAFLDKLH